MPALPQSKDEAGRWLHQFHHAGDTFDAKAFASFFAEDGTMQFGNYPLVTGRSNIEAMMQSAFDGLDMMKHTIRYHDLVDNLLYQAASIRYRAKGDTVENEIEIPGFATMLFVKDGEEKGLIQRAEVFINNQPVMDRIQAVAAAQ